MLHSGIVVQGNVHVFIEEECVSFPENTSQILEEYSIPHNSGRATVFMKLSALSASSQQTKESQDFNMFLMLCRNPFNT